MGYCGDDYYGSQYNEHHDLDVKRPTIEGELFRALGRLQLISELNTQDFKKNGFQSSTRTDRGVHALVNFISVKLRTQKGDEESIVDRINGCLPENIRVWQVQRVNKKFNARSACGSRLYEYMIPTYALGFVIDELKEMFDDNMVSMLNKSEIAIIRRHPTLALKDYPDMKGPVNLYLTNVQQIMNKYRLKEFQWSQFRSIIKYFIGTHNFYNYTSSKNSSMRDPHFQRHIINIDISKPYQVSNHSGEWISIFLEGQSFLLHQIRKMISMSIICMLNNWSAKVIADSLQFGPISIPMAPSLGLILQRPDFQPYNKKLQRLSYPLITVETCQEAIERFKADHIIPNIVRNEIQSKDFVKYLYYISYSLYRKGVK